MKICLSGAALHAHESLDVLAGYADNCHTNAIELWHPKNVLLQSWETTCAVLQDRKLETACVATASELYRGGGSVRDQALLCLAIEMAAQLNAPCVNTYFGTASSRDDRHAIATYQDYLEPCLELAEKLDVTICLENECCATSADPAKSNITTRPQSLLQLFEEVDHPRFRLCLNPVNFYKAGVEPFPYAYDLLRRHVGYVRVNDIRALHPVGAERPAGEKSRFVGCPVGQGAINWSGLIRRLEAASYEGYLCIDPQPAAGNRGVSFLQSARYLHSQLHRIEPRHFPTSFSYGLRHHKEMNAADISSLLEFRCN